MPYFCFLYQNFDGPKSPNRMFIKIHLIFQLVVLLLKASFLPLTSQKTFDNCSAVKVNNMIFYYLLQNPVSPKVPKCSQGLDSS